MRTKQSRFIAVCILLSALCSGSASASGQTNDVRVGNGPPSGSCSNSFYTDTSVSTGGTAFGCKNGAYVQIGAAGSGTVTSFSSGNLSPLFTTSVATATTTPAQTFSLSTAGAHAFLGNDTGSTAAPAYVQPAFTDLSGTATDSQLANAYSGVGTPTACSNQVVTGLTLSRNAAPTSTCTSLTGSFLPNPSATTLGGIESLASVSHKWINAISTAGVPSATQPDISDLTGFGSGVETSLTIANVTATSGTTAISANTCTAQTAVTMTGLTTTMTLQFTAQSDTSTVTGWGSPSAGLLYITTHPTANSVVWSICNGTSSSITPGSSVTWNISAR